MQQNRYQKNVLTNAQAGPRVHQLLLWSIFALAMLSLTACDQANLTDPISTNLGGHGDICGLPSLTASSSSSSFLVLLSVGFFVGLSHCVGMCGPLVSVFVMRRRAKGQEVTAPLVLYQTGRLTTYLLLGAIAGAIGSVLRITAVGHNWQVGLSLVVGGLMLLVGLSLLGIVPLSRRLESAGLARRVGGWIKRFLSAEHPAAPFALGFSNGLLPCGPVYAAILMAATSGDPLRGATIMLLFGLGTLPAILGVGLFASRLSAGMRTHLFRVAAVLVMVVGLQLVLRGLALYGLIEHGTIAGMTLW